MRFTRVFPLIIFAMSVFACETPVEGEVAKGLYEEFEVQAPAETEQAAEFGETERPTDTSSAGGGAPATTPEAGPTASAETNNGANGPAGTPAPTANDDSSSGGSENKYCGDGVCGEGEPESCWIDCSDPPQTTPNDDASSNDDASNGGTDEPAPTPNNPPNTDPPGNGGTWSCVEANCGFEWNMCMSDPQCAALHQCMLSCPGNDACKDQCLALAGPLASLKLDDVALCAAVMGCI